MHPTTPFKQASHDAADPLQRDAAADDVVVGECVHAIVTRNVS